MKRYTVILFSMLLTLFSSWLMIWAVQPSGVSAV
jgi:hypothetical protein